jgi:hypothetical protein
MVAASRYPYHHWSPGSLLECTLTITHLLASCQGALLLSRVFGYLLVGDHTHFSLAWWEPSIISWQDCSFHSYIYILVITVFWNKTVNKKSLNQKCLGGQDGTLLMLAIADPTKEDTESLLTSLPSRTGQLQDRTQVGLGQLANKPAL